MLQLLPFTHKNIIATRANDVLVKNDYKKIQPLVHNIVSAGKKIRWYFEMEDTTAHGLAEFLESGITGVYYWSLNFAHAEDIEKIAIVGTERWIRYMYSMMKPFTKASLLYFDLTDKEKAMEWLVKQDEKSLV